MKAFEENMPNCKWDQERLNSLNLFAKNNMYNFFHIQNQILTYMSEIERFELRLK